MENTIFEVDACASRRRRRPLGKMRTMVTSIDAIGALIAAIGSVPVLAESQARFGLSELLADCPR